MGDLKPGWRRVKFGEIAGCVNDRVDDPKTAGVDRYVGLEHLDSDSLSIRRWGTPDDVESTKLRFRPGDIIFGKRRAYQRKLAVADFEGICSAHAMVLRAKPIAILPEFLPFFMQSDMFMERAVAISVGSLSPTINWKTLAAEEFALPPLEEQRRMAGLLESATQVTDRHRELADSMHRLKRSMIGNRIAELARGRTARLAGLAKVVRGSTPRPAGDPRYFGGSSVPWITVGELTATKTPFLRKTTSMLTEAGAERSRLLKQGTVVLSNSGFSLGVPKVLSIDGCANDGVAAFLDLQSDINPLFLYYVLWGLTEFFRARVAAGGDQPNLNTERIGAVEIPILTRTEQDLIVEFLLSLDTQLERIEARTNKVANQIKQTLHAPSGGIA